MAWQQSLFVSLVFAMVLGCSKPDRGVKVLLEYDSCNFTVTDSRGETPEWVIDISDAGLDDNGVRDCGVRVCVDSGDCAPVPCEGLDHSRCINASHCQPHACDDNNGEATFFGCYGNDWVPGC